MNIEEFREYCLSFKGVFSKFYDIHFATLSGWNK